MIPEAIREQARIKKGDEMDVGYVNGLIVMRKRQPLNAAQVRKHLLEGRRLPLISPKDEIAVEHAIERVRSRRQK